MAEESKGYSSNAVRAGWALALVYFLQSLLTIALPRTEKALPLREELRNWHVLVGVVLLALVVWRLWLWWREERGIEPVGGLRPGLFNWGRTLALGNYLLMVSMPLFGALFAWGGGRRSRWGRCSACQCCCPKAIGCGCSPVISIPALAS